MDTVTAFQRDYGDAPDADSGTGVGNYQTTAADNGPSHVIVPGLHLGRQAPDGDSGALQNLDADADDTTGLDDDDGVASLPIITTAAGAVNVMIAAYNNTGAAATLACWIDFNRDGDFGDAGEQATAPVNSAADRQSVSLTFSGFAVPAPGVSYLRCRIASVADQALSSTGPADNGEVEDYWLTIINVGACVPRGLAQAMSADAEPCPVVSVSGLTWLDRNRDGASADEPTLSEVVLGVYDALGQRVAIVTTGPGQFLAGRYLVDNLPPGKYIVSVDSWPAGYMPLEPRTRKVALPSSGQTASADFSFRRDARIYLPTVLRGQ